FFYFFFSSRRRHTRSTRDWSSDVCSSDLARVLGLMQYLNEAHLVKQGMRFWFYNSETVSFDDCSEIGGRYLARVPAFQVDRSTRSEERRVGKGGRCRGLA